VNEALTGTGAIAAGGMRKHTALLLGAGAMSGALVLGTVLLMDDGSHGVAALAARLTARISALWFLLAFSAGPLARLVSAEWVRELKRERRGIGLGFFAAHTVHLGAIALVVSRGEEMNAVAAIGGGLAYALMFAMAATSNDRAVAWLGARRWQRLHTIGIWYLWLIFAQSYIGRLVMPDPNPAHWLLAGAFLAALVLRLTARWRGRGAAG
jgi:sulfoxide reductase heme-binding subunit YedZ